ncbi:hypothetical protein Bccel_0779 [Pseudobacteroides cellulosolvens ATCC 35603 = DSM 2933]|uniref:Uncharacterized protein n=1 Tax=Pseudobacteroides cellulosolvens ATCC 35603 = DSM 2933 TaxID=398512 RepID=A0A0L6JIF4_9FIRM|nr:hypothetical protein [Pseudobacteroides cellulosolvens]KNY25519.1 hypothetical protein Bccel_0779 [Pseudobacteroides cellulosolvens ATCC 35603 = DSM 2933]
MSALREQMIRDMNLKGLSQNSYGTYYPRILPKYNIWVLWQIQQLRCGNFVWKSLPIGIIEKIK